MLFGDHEHSLDDKGRVAIPARFREQLGERVFITRGFDGNLLGFAGNRWEQLAADLDKLTLADPKARELRRYLFGSASESELDKQGRIVIPPTLRAAAKLASQVIVAGNGSHFEIWSIERWNERMLNFDLNGQDLAAYLGPLGL